MTTDARVKAQLMSASEMDRTLVRLAEEFLEKSKDPDPLAGGLAKRQNVIFSAN